MGSSPRGLRVLDSINYYCKTLPNRFDTKLLNKVKFIFANNGILKGIFTIESGMCNALGTLHGGFSSGAIDAVTTFANLTNTNSNIGWTTNMHVTYLNSAKIGDKVIIHTQPLKVGNSTFMEILLTEETTGKPIVKGTVTLVEGNEKIRKSCYEILNFKPKDD